MENRWKKFLTKEDKMTEYDNYRWKWENYPKLYIIDKVPIHIDLELTTKCNLKCKFCPRTNCNIPIVDMPFSVTTQIIDEFSEKGGSSLKLVYLGEPFLYPRIFDVIKYAKEKGIIEVMLATNGNLITKKVAKDIIESGLDFIIFSIDSCKPQVYKKIRVGGSLETVWKGLKYVSQLKEFFGLDKPKIQVQAIPMELNKEEIESLKYQKLFKTFADTVVISPYCQDYNIIEPIGETPNFFCDGVYQRMTIRADCKAVICCGERKDEKIIGDIRFNTIESMWNSKEFNNIRSLMKDRKSHLIEICKTCPSRCH